MENIQIIKVAHIILVHKNPGQIERLIKSLSIPGFHFFIHVDSKIDITPFLYLQQIKDVSFIMQRATIHWAGYGTIEATLNSLREIFKKGASYDYFHIISGQDYPIQSPLYIANFLKENYGAEFFDRLDKIWTTKDQERFKKYHLINYQFKGKFLLEKFINFIMPKRKFPMKGEVAGSANWFIITSNCASFLLEQTQKRKKLIRHFKYIWGADELMFINLIIRSGFNKSLYTESIRYIDWPSGSGSPKTLTMAEFPLIINSGKLFARKFDIAVDAKILDAIDCVIKQKK